MRVPMSLFGASLVLLLAASSVMAQGQEQQGGENAAQPRFMLRSAEIDEDKGEAAERELTAEDFAWPALTGFGPAAGAEPKVGDRSRGAYFDFHDGLPAPYYFTAKD